jgi:hypothetical protein
LPIVIENQSVELSDIKQLYPAAIVKTGYEDETTQVSLEWLDVESKGQVELVNYAIFLELKDESKFSFHYSTREELFQSISDISRQIQTLHR